MAKMSRWSYKSVATVYPVSFGGKWEDEITFGEPYLIDCNWVSTNEKAVDANGSEFISRWVFNTELLHQGKPVRLPEVGDYIAQDDTRSEPDPRKVKEGGSKIRAVDSYDMKMFRQDPDYKIRT
ncbi:hypothetical protein ID850_18030 [Xenorhabdus sp. Flor]|uniref:hypothetical protein n=1 Tax=Xenorhabdus cabanillasii TaxID=351673 RepID=UPI0019AEEF4E|nr:hypothetical protein [Xenorhabdus sp. Flor]MBD2816592.1 hypothetical protein [Xenorhabdus sp. Flor]